MDTNPALNSGDPITEVVCGIVQYQGRILATRLAPHRRNAGRYEFPGGKVEAREELEEALHRELKEELGIEVAVGRHFHTVEAGRLVLHAFFCTCVTDKVVLVDHDEARWLELSELSTLDWVEMDKGLVEKLVTIS